MGDTGNIALGCYFFFMYLKRVKVTGPKLILKSSMTVSIVSSDFISFLLYMVFRIPIAISLLLHYKGTKNI